MSTTTAHLEKLLLVFATCAAIADVVGGEAFNFSLAIMAIPVVWARNARGILFLQYFFLLLLILDMVFYGTQSWRSTAAMFFTAVNTILKVPIMYLLHVQLHELGASYSWSVPVTSGAELGSSTGSVAPFVASGGYKDASGDGEQGEATPGAGASASAEVKFSSYQGV